MTGATSTLADLLAECDDHGIRLLLAGDGGLTIDAPEDTLTPDLLDRLKANKADVVAMLRPVPDLAPINQGDAAAVWQTALDRLEGDPLFPPDVMEGMRTAGVRWADNALAGYADSPDPCPVCGSLELWETLAGNWRCRRCDPPTVAQRLREQAARLKRNRTDSPEMSEWVTP